MSDDPLRYFRIEAQELVGQLEAGLVGYEKHPEVLPELFRFAHTLKGGARVVRCEAIADLAHTLEDVLAHHREAGTQLGRQEVGELLGIVDAVRGELGALNPGAQSLGAQDPGAHGPVVARQGAAKEVGRTNEASSETSTPAPVLDFETVRVGLNEMDALAAAIHEAEALSSALLAELSALAEARRGRATDAEDGALERERRLRSIADSLEIELRRLGEQTNVLRLLDASMAFPELERAAYDASVLTGKDVEFSTRGGGVKLDGHVLSPLRGALLHLVRNAVAHGVEGAEARVAQGKSPRGKVEVAVERRGARIAFVVSDDGGGIDFDAVHRAAVARGIAVDQADAFELIFQPGLSTSGQVSDLSGRGVGLDAVRATVRKLKGRIDVRSRIGEGTTFEIVVPVSLSAIRALVVRIGSSRLLVPLDAVVSTLRLESGNWTVRGEGRVLLHEGQAIPLHGLHAWLDPSAKPEEPRLALVLRTSRGPVGLMADALAGTRDVIVRPLPHAAGLSPLVAGAAFDSQGDPELVFDPEGLGLVARSGDRLEAAERPRAKRILVVDDSLTTRMLEQSILEAAGYDVDLASSAEEGLEKAMRGAYGLIVTDVEMPGMNGYEFTAETRRRPALRAIPVIMVSSLASEESRKRGADAGISAYIVKGEFDQGAFLGAVKELLR